MYHYVMTKCYILYVEKMGVASECIAYMAWQFSAEAADMLYDINI